MSASLPALFLPSAPPTLAAFFRRRARGRRSDDIITDVCFYSTSAPFSAPPRFLSPTPTDWASAAHMVQLVPLEKDFLPVKSPLTSVRPITTHTENRRRDRRRRAAAVDPPTRNPAHLVGVPQTESFSSESSSAPPSPAESWGSGTGFWKRARGNIRGSASFGCECLVQVSFPPPHAPRLKSGRVVCSLRGGEQRGQDGYRLTGLVRTSACTWTAATTTTTDGGNAAG